MGKPKNTQEVEIVSIEFDELKGILGRAKGLSKEEAGKLEGALDTLALLTQELESKKTSLKRLRRMLFGPSSEKSKDILEGSEKEKDQEENTDEQTEQGKKEGDEAGSESRAATNKTVKEKRKGHGRIGAAAYTGAKRVAVPLAELTNKQKCPDPACKTGKVYRQRKAKVLVRVTGMAPLSATVYELERYRCNICGKVFTAKSPEGVGDEKYDHTVAPMLGLLKYGTGLPFYRLAGLQKQLGMPLPASTQWGLLLKAELKFFALVFDELIRQAAQGKLLYNDDTTMRILDLRREIVGVCQVSCPVKRSQQHYPQTKPISLYGLQNPRLPGHCSLSLRLGAVAYWPPTPRHQRRP